MAGFAVDSFRFEHYANQAVTYAAKIEAAPSHRGQEGDFTLAHPTVDAPACPDGQSVTCDMEVTYQPSALGESRALLVVSGPGGGEYRALLTGYAQPPQPQGPFPIQNGKSAEIKFRNPFTEAATFLVQVDNAAFEPTRKELSLQRQAVESVIVGFKSPKPVGGRLIISCEKVSTPWIFFLKGEV
jgi:hydrocephalus-inducing protein